MDPVWAAMENLWLHFLAREIVTEMGFQQFYGSVPSTGLSPAPAPACHPLLPWHS